MRPLWSLALLLAVLPLLCSTSYASHIQKVKYEEQGTLTIKSFKHHMDSAHELWLIGGKLPGGVGESQEWLPEDFSKWPETSEPVIVRA
jgi:hypothetical protein